MFLQLRVQKLSGGTVVDNSAFSTGKKKAEEVPSITGQQTLAFTCGSFVAESVRNCMSLSGESQDCSFCGR